MVCRMMACRSASILAESNGRATTRECGGPHAGLCATPGRGRKQDGGSVGAVGGFRRRAAKRIGIWRYLRRAGQVQGGSPLRQPAAAVSRIGASPDSDECRDRLRHFRPLQESEAPSLLQLLTEAFRKNDLL